MDKITFLTGQLQNDAERASFHTFPENIEKMRAKILKDSSVEVYEEMDNDAFPVANRRAAEKAMFYYISSGDIEKVSALLNQSGESRYTTDSGEQIKTGNISEKPLLQELSLFISAVTLFTRAALDGGLPEAIAYSLSDCYIRNGLGLSDAQMLKQLSGSAMFDFTYEVYKYKYGSCSPMVRKCCEYIMSHMHDAITVSDLAKLSGKSNNYVSDTFFKELGIRPIQYIRDLKLDYARHTLEIADISIASLSDLLAFPSTSAFIAYFKEKYGVTPFKYRESL